MVLNRSRDSLVMLIATHDRLPQLRASLDALERGTCVPLEIVVIDGGSTDGTIEHLRARPSVIPLLQGERVGVARAYNAAWREIDSRYTGWLSDDTELVPGSLDLAVRILDQRSDIGMVGLKMKDTIGPWSGEDYMGQVSEIGILNCNHAVMRTELLREVGYFNEDYYSYIVDPDLVASFLSAGSTVVMTKRLAVLHHREWATLDPAAKLARDRKGVDADRVYRTKFRYLDNRVYALRYRVAYFAWRVVARTLYARVPAGGRRLGLQRRDWLNLLRGRFIGALDPLRSRGRDFHLVQRIPTRLLRRSDNPYRHLVART